MWIPTSLIVVVLKINDSSLQKVHSNLSICLRSRIENCFLNFKHHLSTNKQT